MKRMLIATAVLVASLNLSGCMVALAGGNYHPDHGDLVNNDGTVRYVGWCHLHPRNSHCQNGPGAIPEVMRQRIVVARDGS